MLTKETIYPYETWVQTFPIYWNKLLSTYDRTNKYTNTELPGILPLTQPYSQDRAGLELISTEGGIPIYLDLWNNLRHTMIMATSRAGKGILMARIITHHLTRGIPVSIIDYPKEDGTGTFTDYANFLGDLASYFNPEKEKINIFEIPNLSNFDLETRTIRFNAFKEGVQEILETMVCGSKPRPEIDVDTIRSLLTLAVENFYDNNNQKIFNRFIAAYKAGFGSPEWQNTPTLKDFIELLGPERLGITSPSASQVNALKHIRLRLNYWLETKVGRAISSPSTIKSETLLTVYALTALNNEDDASVMALAINQEAERKSMAHPESVIIIDEVSIQIDFEAIARMIARKCASGLKAGIQIILSGQDVDSIALSPYKAKILANIKTKIIGLLEPAAIDAMEQVLKYEHEIIKSNTSQKFQPIPHQLATNWLIDHNGKINFVYFHADPITLAVAANNTNEVNRRAEVMNQYGEANKFIGLKAFADELQAKITSR